MSAFLVPIFFLIAADPTSVAAIEEEPRSILEEHGYEMVVIQPGTFTMGSPEDEPGRDIDEKLHQVQITKAFEIGKTEITIRLYEAVAGNTTLDPIHYKKAMFGINWFGMVEFCNKLSELEGLTPAYRTDGKKVYWDTTANGYRLPTEAEWEYAARGGESYVYSGSDNLDEVGWHPLDGEAYRPVGRLQPNAWGLQDMSGNLWELCWDHYDEYPTEPEVDPVRTNETRYHVGRGGAYDGKRYTCCRVADRERFDHYASAANLGFRIARNADNP